MNKDGKDLMFKKIVIQTIHILNSTSKINKFEYTYCHILISLNYHKHSLYHTLQRCWIFPFFFYNSMHIICTD